MFRPQYQSGSLTLRPVRIRRAHLLENIFSLSAKRLFIQRKTFWVGRETDAGIKIGQTLNLWNLVQQRCGNVSIRIHLQSESEFLNQSL